MTRHAQIIGIGSYLPEHILTNSELERMVETSDEWIVTRTGIRERRVVADGETTSDLAVRAAALAIERAGISGDEIDLIVLGTTSPDHIFPSTACMTQAKLGLTCPAVDVMAACTSFIYALHYGSSVIEAGRAQTVLIIGAEALTRLVDFGDRSTCVLFGDGAGAAVLRVSDEPGVEAVLLGADGTGADQLNVPGGGAAHPLTAETLAAGDQYLKMNGNEVFKFAVRVIPRATMEVLEASGHTTDDLAWLVPHQANKRIIDTIEERLGIDDSRVFCNVDRTGNTSSASIPLALDELYTSGQLAPGDLLALVGFGAGLTWGAAVVRWSMSAPNKKE
ncbi:MAG: 3-oxoacyl-ACP synthase [Actinobacteria bacterium HGW-Actinobacteria-7]|nr:MAG: 3-oxoacyl-ACP synthase [Actinobacteria bacterium HGW-Actinobacteria-7]